MTAIGLPAITAGMTEATLQADVTKMCRNLGLRYFHCSIPQFSKAGFPDLVIVGSAGVLWRELKRENGRVSQRQEEWLADLRRAGQDAGVWRPADLVSGVIATELARAAGMIRSASISGGVG